MSPVKMDTMDSVESMDTVFHRRTDLHLARKIWHIATGLSVLYLYFSTSQNNFLWAQIIGVVAILGFTIDFLRLRVPRFNSFMMTVAGPFYRESERSKVSGLPYYALGAALTLYLFPQKISILAILFLVISDPSASFFGIKFGSGKILPNKSFKGTLACFSTCYLISLFYCMHYYGANLEILIFSIIAGVIGASSELLSVFIDDNLTIPVVSGLGLTLLNYIFNLF